MDDTLRDKRAELSKGGTAFAFLTALSMACFTVGISKAGWYSSRFEGEAQ